MADLEDALAQIKGENDWAHTIITGRIKYLEDIVCKLRDQQSKVKAQNARRRNEAKP